jgi:hypothetical protein
MKRLRRFEWHLIACMGIGVLTACTSTTRSTEKQIGKEQKFLLALHALVKQPPMSVEKISTTFGWKTIEIVQTPDKSYIDFNEYATQPRLNPRLILDNQSDRKTFSRDFPAEEFCLRSTDVIAEFGRDFKPTPLLIPLPSLDTEKLSDAVKKDYSLFSLGPRYFNNYDGVHTEIYFQFFFSECASSVFAITTNSKDLSK